MKLVQLPRGNRTRKRGALRVALTAACVCCVAAFGWSGVAGAQLVAQRVYTRADYAEWLTKYANAKPDFKVVGMGLRPTRAE
jgi:hypothetical protein